VARKAKPPPRQAPAFSAAEWASLDEAFARAKAALGSRQLAERELRAHLRNGRLPAAALRIAADGAELFEAVAPSFFATAVLTARSGNVEIVEIDALIAGPSGVEAPPDETSSFRAFFVARRDLDKLYPVAAAANHETDIPSPRRKPGPRPTKNWKLYVAAELHRIVEIEGKQPPVASHFAQLCENKLGYQPEIREVQKLLKLLL
jgi:hypothetical protein